MQGQVVTQGRVFQAKGGAGAMYEVSGSRSRREANMTEGREGGQDRGGAAICFLGAPSGARGSGP